MKYNFLFLTPRIYDLSYYRVTIANSNARVENPSPLPEDLDPVAFRLKGVELFTPLIQNILAAFKRSTELENTKELDNLVTDASAKTYSNMVAFLVCILCSLKVKGYCVGCFLVHHKTTTIGAETDKIEARKPGQAGWCLCSNCVQTLPCRNCLMPACHYTICNRRTLDVETGSCFSCRMPTSTGTPPFKIHSAVARMNFQTCKFPGRELLAVIVCLARSFASETEDCLYSVTMKALRGMDPRQQFDHLRDDRNGVNLVFVIAAILLLLERERANKRPASSPIKIPGERKRLQKSD
jgi:hypothetical protein